jgi:hypothetical protein
MKFIAKRWNRYSPNISGRENRAGIGIATVVSNDDVPQREDIGEHISWEDNPIDALDALLASLKKKLGSLPAEPATPKEVQIDGNTYQLVEKN